MNGEQNKKMKNGKTDREGKGMFFFGVGITFLMLVLSVITGTALILPLFISLLIFVIYAAYKGCGARQIWCMIRDGAMKSMVVVQVMLVIGMLTASWFLSGTIPYLVRLGIRIITPKLFLLSAFFICAAMSISIGTSFGTVNTLGVVLMVIARGSGVNLAMTAGAIASGIFVGDRCSPMSSSLVLLSTVTETDLYENSKMCFRTILVPAGVSALLYGVLSALHPMGGNTREMSASIARSFVQTPWLLIPIVVIFVLCLKKVPIKITMLCSIIVAVVQAFLIQKFSASYILHSLVSGFALPEGAPSAEIMHGGGFLSMVSTCVIVLLSCMITNILEATQSLEALKGKEVEKNSLSRYLRTLLTGFGTAAIGCNQTVGIIMTTALRRSAYGEDEKDSFARDISIAGSIVPAMVPWSIAIYTPIHSLGFEGIGYYPYMFLLIALVIWGVVPAYRSHVRGK